MTVAIDIAHEAPVWMSIPDAEAVIRRAIEEAVADAALGNCEIGVVLTDDQRMRALNLAWRGINEATNVLSFPAPERPSSGPRLLGDLVFAHETLMREASTAGLPPRHHLSHLAVHGVLHLLGYDHQSDKEAEAMEHRERAILARLGVSDPYAHDDRQLIQSA